MSILVALLSAAAVGPVAEAPAAHEIEVVASRLKNWHGIWRIKDGAVRCKTRRSTGDKRIDAIGCEAMVQCMAPLAPRFDAIQNAELEGPESRLQIKALLKSENLEKCFASRREAGIAALVDARRSKRS